MDALGFLGTATLAFGCAAWSAVAAAKRFDRHFPAPANDSSGIHGGAAAARPPRGASMTSTALRQGLPELPQRMRALPVDARGYPLPYCANPDGAAPDYRSGDSLQLSACIYYKHCCLCGQPLGQYKAFVTDALSCVTRTSARAPAHIECAKFAAQACAVIEKRACVVLVWVTRSYEMAMLDDNVVFRMGEAEQTFWYAGGRLASREEVMASVQSGLPALYELAHADSEAAVLELDTAVARATRYFPAHAAASAIRRPA